MSRFAAFKSYVQAVPRILTIQVVTDTVMTVCNHGLKAVAGWALASQGRVAVTTGDFMFLFTSWQGLLLIVLALVAVYVSVTFDVNAMIAFAGHWLRGEDDSARTALRDGLVASRRFLTPTGLLVVLYMALLAPILGVGLSISLTKNLYVPNFITSVIFSSNLYTLAYVAFFIVFALVGFLGTFVVFGVVLDNMSVRDSIRQSVAIIRKCWLDYIWRMVLFDLVLVLCGIVVMLFTLLLAVVILNVLSMMGVGGERFSSLFLMLSGSFMLMLLLSLNSSLIQVKATERYLAYTDGLPEKVAVRRHRNHPFMILAFAGAAALIAIGAYILSQSFDTAFPLESKVQVVAHRACGTEGPENTAAGLDVAAQAAAWGAEIDIQRTADGYYVVNHDDNFYRVAGDPRRPSEMTLAEVKALSVANAADPSAPRVPVSTYEEMLEGSRDRLILFVELKGRTADRQMADDAVRIARERGMLDQCVFISLKYDLIDYLEDTYPDVQTGFLAFASYGNTAALNTDYLALEEEAMSSLTISAIHAQGKKALVWTVNNQEAQRHFLLTGVDGIITDRVTQANDLREALAARDDSERIADFCSQMFVGSR